MNDDLGGEDLEHTLKEPMPGTSRSMMDIDSHHLVDDGFGGNGFGSMSTIDASQSRTTLGCDKVPF